MINNGEVSQTFAYSLRFIYDNWDYLYSVYCIKQEKKHFDVSSLVFL
ncbi:hypothetical protein FH5_01420 [Priestia endophytica]|nr:hypothetical protein FH5_01420 [Priestia endophytica]